MDVNAEDIAEEIEAVIFENYVLLNALSTRLCEIQEMRNNPWNYSIQQTGKISDFILPLNSTSYIILNRKLLDSLEEVFNDNTVRAKQNLDQVKEWISLIEYGIVQRTEAQLQPPYLSQSTSMCPMSGSARVYQIADFMVMYFTKKFDTSFRHAIPPTVFFSPKKNYLLIPGRIILAPFETRYKGRFLIRIAHECAHIKTNDLKFICQCALHFFESEKIARDYLWLTQNINHPQEDLIKEKIIKFTDEIQKNTMKYTQRTIEDVIEGILKNLRVVKRHYNNPKEIESLFSELTSACYYWRYIHQDDYPYLENVDIIEIVDEICSHKISKYAQVITGIINPENRMVDYNSISRVMKTIMDILFYFMERDPNFMEKFSNASQIILDHARKMLDTSLEEADITGLYQIAPIIETILNKESQENIRKIVIRNGYKDIFAFIKNSEDICLGTLPDNTIIKSVFHEISHLFSREEFDISSIQEIINKITDPEHQEDWGLVKSRLKIIIQKDRIVWFNLRNLLELWMEMRPIIKTQNFTEDCCDLDDRITQIYYIWLEMIYYLIIDKENELEADEIVSAYQQFVSFCFSLLDNSFEECLKFSVENVTIDNKSKYYRTWLYLDELFTLYFLSKVVSPELALSSGLVSDKSKLKAKLESINILTSPIMQIQWGQYFNIAANIPTQFYDPTQDPEKLKKCAILAASLQYISLPQKSIPDELITTIAENSGRIINRTILNETVRDTLIDQTFTVEDVIYSFWWYHFWKIKNSKNKSGTTLSFLFEDRPTINLFLSLANIEIGGP